MFNIKDIPAEVRWEIATKAANSQSVVYDMLVRQIIGDKIDEIWNVILTEGGKESKNLAESLGLPGLRSLRITARHRSPADGYQAFSGGLHSDFRISQVS